MNMEWAKKSGLVLSAMLVGGAVVHTTYKNQKPEPQQVNISNYFPA